eukprot:CAMPEP_0172807660 /NCGR_PEP_ID=MMETSP1075-20121228/7148_1 /TAXON_ID=2916 /ORGANISM="Ceratium fusus, Strain PA161109" /LENGTH=411 /DNA_ID=CAMNT_0013646683 /DNA_START=122 /DNA_END=1357 /DNA_ORIENTATION=-
MKWIAALGPLCCLHKALALIVDAGVGRTTSSSLHSNGVVQPNHGFHHSWAETMGGNPITVHHAYGEPPTVVHEKQPGQGYEQGSPLYQKQEVFNHVLTADQRRNLTHNPTTDGKFIPGGGQGVNGTGEIQPCSSADARNNIQLYHDFPLSLMLSNLVYLVLVIAVGIYYQRYLRHRSTPVTEVAPREDARFINGLFSLGNCKQEGHIYLTACCCPAVRWAATVSSHKTPMLAYWPALGLMIGIAVSMGFLLAPYYFVIACHFFGPDRGFLIVLAMVIFIGAIQSFAALMWFDMACWWLSTAFAVRGLTAVLGPWACLGIYLLMLIPMMVGIMYRRKLRDVFGHEPKTTMSLVVDVLSWCCCPCCAISQEAKEVEKVLPKRLLPRSTDSMPLSSVEGPRFSPDQRQFWGSEH